MPRRSRPAANVAALKALVSAYGSRETARQTGIPYGTVAWYCRKYKWKRAQPQDFRPDTKGQPIANQDPGDALATVLGRHKTASTLNLAQYTAKASKQALQGKDALGKARRVRDVAAVYRTLWPEERSGELIEAGILIGTANVEDQEPQSPEKQAVSPEKDRKHALPAPGTVAAP
jgi:hypothetical protein